MTSLLEIADRLHLHTADIRRTVALRENTIAGGRGAIYDIADDFRRRLDRTEETAIRTVLDQWGRIRAQIDDELATLDQLLKADGQPDVRIEAARDRLARRRDQIVKRVDSYARHVQAAVFDAQTEAATIAGDETVAIVDRQLGPKAAPTGIRYDRLPADAVEQLLGQLQTGSPLATLVRDLGRDAWRSLEQELIDGLAYGRNPRAIARRMLQTVDMPRWRALTVARTETLRAYREVHRQTTMVNRDIIAGTTWLAALDDRTCPVCWAMHGTEHPPEYTMATHPACRCTLVPRTKTWAELGIPGVEDTPSLITSDGPSLFARQPAALQRSVLGPGRFEAYRDGLIGLPEMVGFRDDPSWGPTSYVRPLAELLAGVS